MGLTIAQTRELDLCDAFLTELEEARTNLENLWAGKEVCEQADFMAMPIRPADKLFIVLREEVTPLATLQEIDSEILDRLSPSATTALAQIRTLGDVHYYANAAHVYTMDFTRLVPTPASPVSVNPLTGEEEQVEGYVAPSDPTYVSSKQVKQHIIDTVRARAETLLAIVEGLL